MRITHFLLAVSLVPLIACSTAPRGESHRSSGGDPETVLVTYHVKPGKEGEFQEALSHVWEIYRKQHLVFTEPHVIVRDKEDGGKTGFVEAFTWVSHAGPEQVPDSVKKIWDQMQSLCEARNGHDGLEGGEVELLTPELSGSKK
jgi:hypothetical protein